MSEGRHVGIADQLRDLRDRAVRLDEHARGGFHPGSLREGARRIDAGSPKTTDQGLVADAKFRSQVADAEVAGESIANPELGLGDNWVKS